MDRASGSVLHPVHGELPNWPEWSALDVLILLPGCATSLFYSFI